MVLDFSNYCFSPGQTLFVRRFFVLNFLSSPDFLPEHPRLLRLRQERLRRRPAAERSNPSPVLLVGNWYLLPFFLAVLAAMNIGAYTASKVLFTPRPDVLLPGVSPSEIPLSETPLPEDPLPPVEISSAFLLEPEVLTDEIAEYYQDPRLQDGVIEFFTMICGSEETAGAILEESERFAVSPSLAFALCWVESRYNNRALNRRNRDGSIDRGLFQLNSNSFPNLSEADYFDPRKNVYYGMAHLRFCLDVGESEIVALAMYNAGSVRVHAGGTPRQSLDYAAKVLSARRKIQVFFLEKWAPFRAVTEVPKQESPEPPEEAEPRTARDRRSLALL
jgi:hypothetical protein